jgi:hypothetical protein
MTMPTFERNPSESITATGPYDENSSPLFHKPSLLINGQTWAVTIIPVYYQYVNCTMSNTE